MTQIQTFRLDVAGDIAGDIIDAIDADNNDRIEVDVIHTDTFVADDDAYAVDIRMIDSVIDPDTMDALSVRGYSIDIMDDVERSGMVCRIGMSPKSAEVWRNTLDAY